MRWLIVVACGAACASTEVGSDGRPDASQGVPAVPSATDGGVDAAHAEADAGPCADCEYFPDVCVADTLCPNGPFEPSTVGGPLDPRVTINVIRSRSVTDVWAAGAIGALAHFDGTSWTRSVSDSEESLQALWLRGSGEAAFATLTSAYTRGIDVVDADASPSAGGWIVNATNTPAEGQSNAIKLTSAWSAPDSEWLWSSSMVVGSPGSTGLWRMRLLPVGLIEVQAGVTTAACRVNSCTRMKSIHGASAGELWAVGESGAAILVTDADSDTPDVKAFNAQTWNALNGVWVASSSDAWAVGAAGTIRHYTGDPAVWDVVSDVPTQKDLRAVWGASSTDIWAVGNAGVVLHYDGKSWSRMKVAGLGSRRPNLTTVWAAAPGHVWVGGQGVILSLGGKP